MIGAVSNGGQGAGGGGGGGGGSGGGSNGDPEDYYRDRRKKDIHNMSEFFEFLKLVHFWLKYG